MIRIFQFGPSCRFGFADFLTIDIWSYQRFDTGLDPVPDVLSFWIRFHILLFNRTPATLIPTYSSIFFYFKEMFEIKLAILLTWIRIRKHQIL